MSGTTGVASVDTVSLTYSINQNVDHSGGAPIFVDGFSSGLWIGVTSDRPVIAQITDGSGNLFCAPLFNQDGTPEFLGWTGFNQAACGLGTEVFFDPIQFPVLNIGVKVDSREVSDDPVSLCIETLDAIAGPPGYLGIPGQGWFGAGSTVADPDSAVTFDDLAVNPFPNCASGTTGPNPDDYAGLQYNVNQPLGQGPSSGLFTAPGVLVDVAANDGRQRRVELVDSSEGIVWCVPLPGPGQHFIPREEFITNCESGEGQSLPSEAMIDVARVVTVTDGSPDSPWTFCLTHLQPDNGPMGPPPGYLNGPDWQGEGFELVDASSTIDSDLDVQPAPNCASGTTGPDAGAFAGLGYNINQPVGGSNTPTLLVGSGVVVDVGMDGAQDLVLELVSLGTSSKWCAPISGLGVQFVPYGDFNTACDGSGSPFDVAQTPIDHVAVVALGTGSPDEPYTFCISDLRPQFGGPQSNGYLQNPVWKGFGQEFISGDAILTSNLNGAPMPTCAMGTTGVLPSSEVGLYYAVNESPAGGDNTPVGITNFGVWVDFQATGEVRPYVLRAMDTAGDKTWCTTLSTTVSTFVPWTNFSDNCADPPNGAPPQVGVDQIDYIGLFVPSTGIEADPYSFCVVNFQPMDVPPGYLDGPSWFGYGFASTVGGTVQSDLNKEPAPNCIWGETAASPSSSATLEYNVNQGVGTANTPILMGGDGMLIDVDNPLDREVRVEVWSFGAELGFCSVLPTGLGPHFIPWTSFNDTCWTTGGVPFDPGSLSIDQVRVHVISSGLADDPYDLCVMTLEEMSIPE